jgi:tRNA (guanine37-N1)-methyltransferase
MAHIHFDILTLFPDMIEPYTEDSILKRAQEKGLISIDLHNWRAFAQSKHKNVDDTTYGGGTGMLLKVDPLYNQLRALEVLKRDKKKTRVLLMTPEGKKFNHKSAVRLSKYERVVLIAGRYEGFDARVEQFVDEKISIGPYVLSGGELPALVVLEAVARQVPGVLGHSEEALANETFAAGASVGEYPQYTRPEHFKTDEGETLSVPEVLLSGDHAKIAVWRKSQARKTGRSKH